MDESSVREIRLKVGRDQILEGLECQAREYIVQAEEPVGGSGAGEGFEGKFSSTVGVICPVCPKEEAELYLLFSWHRVT